MGSSKDETISTTIYLYFIMSLEFLLEHGELETFLDAEDIAHIENVSRTFRVLVHSHRIAKRWLSSRLPFPIGWKNPTTRHCSKGLLLKRNNYVQTSCSVYFREYLMIDMMLPVVSGTWKEKLWEWYSRRKLLTHYFFFVDSAIPHRMRCLPNVYYWEILLESNPRGFCYGFSALDDFRYIRCARVHVGFTKRSMGYCQNGDIYRDDARVNKKREFYSQGDIVGCGYDVSSQKIWFTKNGVVVSELGWCTTGFPTYPVLSMDNNMKYSINDGWCKPFVFDLETHCNSKNFFV